ncbi:cysteine desulfurase NifS [candidate division WOR-1 bacterium RIFOXYB2_FULL_42_35]|uniref:Cysteine desulfurase IscS n=1 Tax=candidate division WOR-1 bacterium RIFOXYC2_FULL_41_25 TaxID=1802586 RepID=A0A1F4TLC9_UNCSA|nr:MAG: cysteine desulfurase NifS [candidate division WOR-1 bacterium RIFOXYA2_FULL_41_14]OGC22936.1 MAG: cysteine desulfurase NifS [candidate division WOR-1 bacterium RIFOXYB2_FULL_42_35]OGC33417.1 MAG: cysteine desulfurase NifS [candidate division WOR-1 bacterium RIFOXYC2_FULL_41_25]OGC43473.1 MAG: cysteine desulfurase NifS [candidate division WOR-1 bacterium RIFOXYD2_FULL_41_8]
MRQVYMDYAATTPPLPEVVEAMLPYLDEKRVFGNPSSLHSFGQEARAAVEEARAKVAALINADPREIVFTSGGTESDNFALHGVLYANKDKKDHIITTKIEHSAILAPCRFLEKQGFKVTYLNVDKDGLVDPEEVKAAITDKTALVSIMHANNEIGTIEPIAEIAKLLNGKGVYFHTDAVQTVGQINVDVKELGVDLLSASAHKFYGPKGAGFLYIKKGTRMKAFMLGGEQEQRRRGSTENVPGIMGMGKACEIAKIDLPNRIKHLTDLRDKLSQGLLKIIPDIHLNGHPTKRLPKNVDVSVQFIEGESMLLNLDLEGIAVSTGSACSSSTLEPSHVLLAIGKPPEEAHGSIRFTLGRLNTEADVDYVLDIFPKIVEKLRAMSPLVRRK